MKKVFLIFQLLLVVMLAQAQMMNPVKFTSSLKTDGIIILMPIWSMAPATTRTVCHQARLVLSRVANRQPLMLLQLEQKML